MSQFISVESSCVLSWQQTIPLVCSIHSSHPNLYVLLCSYILTQCLSSDVIELTASPNPLPLCVHNERKYDHTVSQHNHVCTVKDGLHRGISWK